jgi:predicted O-methyltransferase YrrM
MIRNILKFVVLLGSPLTVLSAIWLKIVKKVGTDRVSDKIFMLVGILPVLDHYYQPLINPKKHLTKSLRDNRDLKGIDFNTAEQLMLLKEFKYQDELTKFPINKTDRVEFYYTNPSYTYGDAEYLYSIIRHYKPKRIVEIGSGYSTLIVKNAVTKNKSADTSYYCQHTCIEPYEQAWLETLEIEVIRKKVEDIDKSFFQKLTENDILFIDSTHIIRPQGDVLFEYLELLPILNPGVLIHIHDILTPKDYLDEWVYDRHYLWNEQYLLEAFLMFNSKFKIIGALNYLSHNYRKEFAEKCPVFAEQGGEPGAFWIKKI